MDTKLRKWISVIGIWLMVVVMTGGLVLAMTQTTVFIGTKENEGLISFNPGQKEAFEKSEYYYGAVKQAVLNQMRQSKLGDDALLRKEQGDHTVDLPAAAYARIQIDHKSYGPKLKDMDIAGQKIVMTISNKTKDQPVYFGDEFLERFPNAKFMVGFSKQCDTALRHTYDATSKKQAAAWEKFVWVLGAEAVGFLLLMLFLLMDPVRTKALRIVDRIWLEVIAFLAVMLFGIGVAACFGMIQFFCGSMTPAAVFGCFVIFFCINGALVLLLQTVIWRIKDHRFWESAVCIASVKRWWKNANERKDQETKLLETAEQITRERIRQYHFRRKVYGLLIAMGIVVLAYSSVAGIMIFVAAALGLYKENRFFVNMAKEEENLSALIEQIDRIAQGDLTAKTGIPEDSVFYEPSKQLGGIGGGLEKSLQEQMKGERMKIDLITNVSHDLKTPLTSIIGYVDLLSKDAALSGEAQDYVQILVQKTNRLKKIIADLFDLAKSTSGEMEVHMETMDMKRLVEQIIGDMDDRIKETGFDIRVSCETEETRFQGDVNKMYRAVQNVFDNALKYSLKGTRIFVSLREAHHDLILTVQNTAGYPMDFTKEEIMQRFARGEKSRSGEGSGLGLSIADSFTKNCGGSFEIFVDGDQFKVQIVFHQRV